MSAAATAAGYLYASGRLRGRGAREQEHAEETKPRAEKPPRQKPTPSQPVRVAVLPKDDPPAQERPKRTPRVEYRVRRWRPEPGSSE